MFDAGLRPIVESATCRWIGDLTELIATGQDDGTIGEDVDPPQLATRITALVEGLSNRWLAGLLSTDDTRAHVMAMLDSEAHRPTATLHR